MLKPAETEEGRTKLALYEQHIEARAALIEAFSIKDRKQLRQALDTAENLELRIDFMDNAKELLRELEISYRANKGTEDGEEPEPYDAAEEARKQRQELAKQARFAVLNFPNLRTSDDFARGAIVNKAKVF